MKIRNGFVSNSSSLSFLINKRNLSAEQIDMIKNHIDYCWKLINDYKKQPKEYVENDKRSTQGLPYGEEDWDDETTLINQLKTMMGYGERFSVNYSDKWKINDGKEFINGHTEMDNFDMEWFLTNIVKVPSKNIKWLDY